MEHFFSNFKTDGETRQAIKHLNKAKKPWNLKNLGKRFSTLIDIEGQSTTCGITALKRVSSKKHFSHIVYFVTFR